MSKLPNILTISRDIKLIDQKKGYPNNLLGLDQSSFDDLGKKYIDNPKLWKKTEEDVRGALKDAGLKFVESVGDAAFYGPKIDVQVWSAIGKEFSLATNQVDFAVPERFNLHLTII